MIEDGVTVWAIARAIREKLRMDLWLVGSGARLFLGKMGTSVQDLDFVVPEHFRYGLNIMSEKADRLGCPFERTGFGGYKIKVGPQGYYKKFKDWVGPDLVVVDIWPQDVGSFLRQAPTAYDGVAINVGTGVVLKTPEFDSPTNFEITYRWTRKPKFKPYYIEHLKKQGIGDTWTEDANG